MFCEDTPVQKAAGVGNDWRFTNTRRRLIENIMEFHNGLLTGAIVIWLY